jgi:MerR family transcriptional regulator, copper efflux regulator
MRIGEIAARIPVNVQTLRYYERCGLLPPPARRESGYRDYDVSAVGRVRFIRQAQGLGFTLEEIAQLLALRVDGGTACPDVEHRARATIARVDQQLIALKRIRAVLVRLTAACRSRTSTGQCPVIAAIEGDAPRD